MYGMLIKTNRLVQGGKLVFITEESSRGQQHLAKVVTDRYRNVFAFHGLLQLIFDIHSEDVNLDP